MGAIRINGINLPGIIEYPFKGNPFTIGRPLRSRRKLQVCDLLHVVPIGIHHVDVEFAVSAAIERNPPSVGVPVRGAIRFRMTGQPSLVAPIGVHHIYLIVLISIAMERNLSPVG